MSLHDDHGITAAFQVSRAYLEKAIVRHMYSARTDDGSASVACLPPQGAVSGHPTTQGLTYRHKDVVLRPAAVDFEFDAGQRRTLAAVTLERVSGELEIGQQSVANSSTPVDEITVHMVLSIDLEASTSHSLVLLLSAPWLWIGTASDQHSAWERILSDVRFSLPLPDPAPQLGTRGVSFAPDPARVKALESGTVCIGLNLLLDGTSSPPAVDFELFLDGFADDYLSGTDHDSAMVLDEWIVGQAIQGIDGDALFSDVSSLDARLVEITTTHLRIAGSGLGEIPRIGARWFDYEARAQVVTTVPEGHDVRNTHIDLDVEVTKVVFRNRWIPACAHLVNRTRRVMLMFPSFLGESRQPLGRFDVVACGTRPDCVVLLGRGTTTAVLRPLVDVHPEALVLRIGCGGQGTGSVTVSNPATGSSHAPLRVCRPVLQGEDARAFRIAEEEQGALLASGQEYTFDVRLVGQRDGVLHAEIIVKNTSGEQRVALTGHRANGVLQGVPDSLDLHGVQRRAWCAVHSHVQLSETFEVRAHDGGVTICSMRIEGGSGWTASGIASGQVIPAGESRTITVTYRTTTPGISAPATLKIETSRDVNHDIRRTTHECELSATVEPGQDTENLPPDRTVIGGFDYGTFGIDSARLCFQIDSLHQALILEHKLNNDLEFMWDAVRPGDCCPGPQQPTCLCVDALELSFDGTPPGTRVKIGSLDASNLDLTTSGDRMLLLSPVGSKSAPSLQLAPGRFEDRAVTGSMRRWRITRTTGWTTKRHVTGVAAAAGMIGVVTDGQLGLFSLHEAGALVQQDELELPRGVCGVAAVGDQLVLHSASGLLLVECGPKGARIAREVDAPAQDAFIPLPGLAMPGGDEDAQLALRVHEGTLHLLDLTAPTRAVTITSRKATLPPTTGILVQSRVILAGEGGMEVVEFGNVCELDSRGVDDVPGIATLMAFGSSVYALDTAGRGYIVDVGATEPLKIGEFTFPDTWKDALPSGSLWPLASGHMVAGRLDRCGFNVYRAELGQMRKPAHRRVEPPLSTSVA